MIQNRSVCAEQVLACVVVAATASFGCATAAPSSRTPSLAFGVVASAPSACTIHGTPRVLATRALPPAGVDAESDWSRVWLRFAQKANVQLALAVDPETLEVAEASECNPASLDAKGAITPAAWLGASTANQGGSRTATADAVHALEPIAGSSQSRVSRAVLVRVDAHRSVVAWTEGTLDTGLDVRVLTVGSDGDPLGAPVTLPHEGSAIGLPTLAVASSGQGVVAFLESNGSGFQVVAASLDCGAPGAMEASASWESRAAR
jgi:hypothetical protein